MHLPLLSYVLLSILGLVQALSSSGSRLLVVTDDVAGTDKYSKFWKDLKDRGFVTTFASPKSDPALFQHGARAFDHLLLLPCTVKALGPALTPQILLNFAKEEGNILLAMAANATIPVALRSLLLELDIHLPNERDAVVVDHFNYDSTSASTAHDVLLLPQPGPLRADVKNYFGGSGVLAIPRAIGHTLGNASPLLSPILKAPSTAYSYSPSADADTEPFATGSQLSLVSAMQARNSARFTVLSSAAMLEDTWFDASVTLSGKRTPTANRDFATKLSAWTFKELGVLRVGALQHQLLENGAATGPPNPKIYRITNDASYAVDLSEYDMTRWTPYIAPTSDALQLEFSMLSPYQRLSLTASASSAGNATHFSTTFKLPDHHGIFNFRLNYKRPFLTSVDEKRTVTVRHYAHDEWPRSYAITGAWVWISGIWMTVVGWVLFVAVWLWCAPVGGQAKKRQ